MAFKPPSRQELWKQRKVAKGRCITCGNKTTQRRIRCDYHLELHRDYMREYMATYRTNGKRRRKRRTSKK